MNKKRKLDKVAILALSTVIFLTLVISSLFILVPSLGLFGVYTVLEDLGLAKIDFFDTFLKNVGYFGGFLLALYFLTIVLDTAIKIVFHLLKIVQTRKVLVLNYLLQILICSLLFKSLVDSAFNRIELSFIGVLLLVSVVYSIYYLLADKSETSD